VEGKRRILIVTDGTESTQQIGEEIAKKLRGNEVVVKKTPDLCGTDILPADVYFFGCESPHPRSFAYLEQVLFHINLVGRPCGLFSSHPQEAVQYLAALVRDSELDLMAEPFLGAKSKDIGTWIQEIIK
jgi:hypothetical protein